MLDYNVGQHGAVVAIKIYRKGDRQQKAELAFAFGGTETINWLNPAQLEAFAPGINGYTLMYDERDTKEFGSWLKPVVSAPMSMTEYTVENCGYIEAVRIFYKDDRAPMAELLSSVGGAVTIEWTMTAQRKKFKDGIDPYTYWYDERPKAEFSAWLKPCPIESAYGIKLFSAGETGAKGDDDTVEVKFKTSRPEFVLQVGKQCYYFSVEENALVLSPNAVTISFEPDEKDNAIVIKPRI